MVGRYPISYSEADHQLIETPPTDWERIARFTRTAQGHDPVYCLGMKSAFPC
jgi:hypothetical protein